MPNPPLPPIDAPTPPGRGRTSDPTRAPRVIRKAAVASSEQNPAASPRAGIAPFEWLARPGFAGAIVKSVAAALIGGTLNLFLTHWGGIGVTFAAVARMIPRGGSQLILIGLFLVALVVVSIFAVPARNESNGNNNDL